MTKRTTFRMTDERARRFDKAKDLLARDDHDEPPTSDVIDAALIHLLQSAENITDARESHPPDTIQDIANTDVIKLRYRSYVEQEHR